MGHRLSRIYTKTGDDGTTGLGDGTRVGKDDLRVEAMGTVDELNSAIGRVLAQDVPPAVRECLDRVQHDLFDLGAELCLPGVTKIDEKHIGRLERELDAFNADLPPLKEFILPGGTRGAALAHLARTVCRRAERSLVALARADSLAAPPRIYLNRLSDLLFILGRVINREAGTGDVLWQKRRDA